MWGVGLLVILLLFVAAPPNDGKKIEDKSDSTNSDGASARESYIERRKYYELTGNEVQLDIDRALLGLSGGDLDYL